MCVPKDTFIIYNYGRLDPILKIDIGQNAKLNFARHAVKSYAIASATAARGTPKEKIRYRIDIDIGRYSKLQYRYRT